MLLIGKLVWWTPRGSDVILGIQGRYFIPMIPLVLFAIPKISFNLHRKRGVTRFPAPEFSGYVTMASILLSCASMLAQTAVILVDRNAEIKKQSETGLLFPFFINGKAR